MSVTIKDIAKTSGVSVGTVSKVLNGDKSVKDVNRRAVEEAVESLGYNVNKLARSLAHKPIKIGILLPETTFGEFFVPMIRGVERIVKSLADFKVSAVFVSYSKYDDDEALSARLDSILEHNVDGVVLGPFHYMGLSVNILRKLQERQIPTVFVLSDLGNAQKLACVTIDAELSGKAAAELASLVLNEDETTAVFVGNKDVEEHRLKADSFVSRVKTLGFSSTGVYETQEEQTLAYQLTISLLQKNPKLRLIYVATGNSVAVCRAVCDCGKERNVRVIATDVLTDLRPYVESGLVVGVLDQHMDEQGAMAVSILYQYLSEGTMESKEIKIAPSVLLQSCILNQIKQL